MAMQPTATQSLEHAIYTALEDETHKIKETAIKEAVSQFEDALRKSIGLVAIRLLDYYSVERIGSELVIHVKLEKEKQ